jgi:hypothetical protein
MRKASSLVSSWLRSRGWGAAGYYTRHLPGRVLLIAEFTATPKGLVPAGIVAPVTLPTTDGKATARLKQQQNEEFAPE